MSSSSGTTTMSIIRNASLLLLLAAGVVLVGPSIVACGPDLPDEVPANGAERYAEAMCTQYERCGCVGEGFQDVASCRQAAEELFREAERTPHVSFDAECFETFLDHIPRIGCHGVYETESYEPFPCMPFRGTLARGSACQFDPYTEGLGYIIAGPCEGSESCLGGRCEGPAPEVDLGEPCGYAIGVRCGYGRYCARDGTCHEEVQLAQPCDTPAACTSGAHNYCAGIRPESDMLGECVPRGEAGAACDPEAFGACVLESSCDRSGVCGDAWPVTCHVLSPRDWYDPREWVPEQ
jgi:hypothetical protein